MNNKDQNNFDLLGPLFEGIVEVVGSLVEALANFLRDKMTKSLGNIKKGYITNMKIEPKMLTNTTQVEGHDELGWSVNQEGRYKMSYLRPHMHTFIIGASGWGKSNLINLLMEEFFIKNKPVIYIDPKGSLGGIKEFERLCKHYGRKYHIFSEHYPNISKFNPLSSMNADQALIMIMRSFDWGDKPNQYYLKCSEEALKKVLDHLYSTDRPFGLKEVYKEISTKYQGETTQGLITQLYLLVNSRFGKLFEVNEGDEPMNFYKAWKRRECIYIGVSSMGYANLARTIGKMFVSELQTLAHNIGVEIEDSSVAIENSIGVFIDEAGSILFKDVIDLANKARSSGVNLTFAVQSYSDLEMIGGSEVLMKQLIESFSTWFIQRQLNAENAEKLSGIIGTYESEKSTVMTEGGIDSGKGSLRTAQEFICHPENLKSINVGQAILLTLNPKDVHLLNLRDAKFSTRFKAEIQTGKDNKNNKKPELSIPLGG